MVPISNPARRAIIVVLDATPAERLLIIFMGYGGSVSLKCTHPASTEAWTAKLCRTSASSAVSPEAAVKAWVEKAKEAEGIIPSAQEV